MVEGNQAIADDPALINSDPEGEGWFFKLKLDNPGELDGLMDEAAYREWVQDALSETAVSTSKWDAADYARVGAFVAELGAAALDLLDPQPGEHILDVGCGEGTLTQKIVERGATVLGIDNSPEMVEAAKAKGHRRAGHGRGRDAVPGRVRRRFLQRDAALGARQGAGRGGDLHSRCTPAGASPARWAATATSPGCARRSTPSW